MPQRTGYIRTYRGYDIYRDIDPVYGESWYAALAHRLPNHQAAEALATYPDEQALRRDIDAAHAEPGAVS